MDGSDDYADQESGPFCRHWSEACCCTRICATCGHECSWHFGDDDDAYCNGASGCGCHYFKDGGE